MSNQFNLHAAQMKSLQILKLSIEVHDPVAAHSDDYSFGEYALETGHSAFNEEDSTIQVMMRVRSGKFAVDDSNDLETNAEFSSQPISILAEVGSIFFVNTDSFPKDKISNWAEANAPLILYPYVREQVYGLSTRVGIKPVLLPLLEIPTFRISGKN
ncbi:protein-export chaperone SecB [Pectobacterium quasiaquaticum]|uniref:protein-export chaperone SecB n=1 Tax=Pectobacterium quasiaquaticum TaxID=2774015 RepID=UPI0018751560|nr:protein-export chaperone SecB [Pectobacterium quasiaquaticum]URG53045.1 protein-export chaperone SecB [Pectobacterium quasiaquaticum]